MKLKTTLFSTAVCLALLGALTPAHAGSDRDGWYLGLEGGVTQVRDTSLFSAVAPPFDAYAAIDFKTDLTALGTLGFAFDEGWRAELELGYRNNDLESLNGVEGLSGGLREYTVMVNAVHDQEIRSNLLLSFGVGIGMDSTSLKLDGYKDEDLTFAAQAIAGLTYQVSDHLDVMFNYRYLWADDPRFNRLDCLTSCTAREDNMDIGKHTFTVGLRYGYDTPVAEVTPPAPPVPPTPPAVKQFIVFFGYDKCNITAESDAVLAEAAAAVKSQGAAAIRIVGHTDTSGSNTYNQKLSECRANATKDNLVAKGISEGAITTSGKGETELMVQTGDGVKEPQNRRATVDLN